MDVLIFCLLHASYCSLAGRRINVVREGWVLHGGSFF